METEVRRVDNLEQNHGVREVERREESGLKVEGSLPQCGIVRLGS